MAILNWIGALVVLLVGALILNGVSQSLENPAGRRPSPEPVTSRTILGRRMNFEKNS